MTFKNLKSRFPVFTKRPELVFFDTAASALKVDSMINAINYCYSYEYANIHRGMYDLSSKLTKRYEDSRAKVSEFINSPSAENIIFTKSATEGINLVANCLMNKYFKDGDEIIISYLEHHSNIVPWHIINKNLKLKIVPIKITQNGELDYEDLFSKINSKTKLIALTHMSNVTGAITEFDKLKDVKEKYKIPLLVDGCQFVPHKKLNIQELNPDFYVFSAHKLYGPSGLGILFMKDKWIDRLDPYQGGGSMIKNVEIFKSTYLNGFEKFEAGTPPIAQVIGLSASIDFMNEIGLENIFNYEKKLHDYTIDKLSNFNDLSIYGNSNNKGAIISFNLDKFHFNDLALLLDKKNIAIRSGHHCAQPLMKYFNINGNARMSFGVYNTKKDVDVFIESLKEVKEIFAKNE